MSTGTIDTPDRLKFDEAALARWMAAHVDGFAEGTMNLARRYLSGAIWP